MLLPTYAELVLLPKTRSVSKKKAIGRVDTKHRSKQEVALSNGKRLLLIEVCRQSKGNAVGQEVGRAGLERKILPARCAQEALADIHIYQGSILLQIPGVSRLPSGVKAVKGQDQN